MAGRSQGSRLAPAAFPPVQGLNPGIASVVLIQYFSGAVGRVVVDGNNLWAVAGVLLLQLIESITYWLVCFRGPGIVT